MIFDYKRYYMQLALLIQLINIIGNQLNAFLDIYYNNIKLTLLFNL